LQAAWEACAKFREDKGEEYPEEFE
jgi:hypothetical protein